MPPVVAADADADRPGSGWSALAAAIIADAIERRDRELVDRPAFALLLELANVKVAPAVCRAAIKRRWLAEGRP
jgi:hypothetical protein